MLACDRACVFKYTLATELDIVQMVDSLFLCTEVSLFSVYFLYKCEHLTLLALAATPSYILAA